MLASFWEAGATYLSVLTPLVAVPLTVITFYLRSIREHELSWSSEWGRKFNALEAAHTDLRRAVNDFERDYTTKEEWLRECMHTRGRVEQLSETTARLSAVVDRGVASPHRGQG